MIGYGIISVLFIVALFIGLDSDTDGWDLDEALALGVAGVLWPIVLVLMFAAILVAMTKPDPSATVSGWIDRLQQSLRDDDAS